MLSQLCDWTQDMWSAIIGLFGFIPSWGWMIIVFTIVLKLVLSPLDFWQKKSMRDQQKKMAALKPEMEKIQKSCGNNKLLYQKRMQELQKREGIGLGSSCLVMLIPMALTLFIFFTLFSGLMGMSRTEILKQYENMEDVYNKNFATEFNISESQVSEKESLLWNNAVAEAKVEIGTEELTDEVYSKALEIYASNEKIVNVQNAVKNAYENEFKESFLWIKNVWSPDTNSAAFKGYNDFANSSGIYNTEEFKSKTEGKTEDQIKAIKESMQTKYSLVTYRLQEDYKGVWNGYFILVILAGAVTYVSMIISQRQSNKKKTNQALTQVNTGAGMKILKFILPIIMIVFTIGYSAAFAIYIVMNSLMTTLISFVTLAILDKMDSKKKDQNGNPEPAVVTNKYRPAYSRENTIDAVATPLEEKEVVTELPKKTQMQYRQDFKPQPKQQYNQSKHKKHKKH